MADDKGKITEIYSESYTHIYGELRNYWMNHSFVRGLQWLGWGETVGHLVDQSRKDERIRMIVNRIRANQRTIMGNLTQRQLTFQSMPSMADDASIRSARLGEAILRDLGTSQGWEVVREEHMAGTTKGGTGALMTEIDPETRLPTVKALSIAEFVVEPGSRRAEFARWVIKVEALPPKVVKALFGLKVTPPADAKSGLGPFQNQFLNQDFGSNNPTPELTRVLTYYERPMGGKQKTKGKWMVEVDGKIVDQGKWPFPFDNRLPIAVARESIEENQWYGTTYMNDVRKVQILMNHIWSGIAEHAKELATKKVVYPSAARSFVEEMDDQPGWVPWPEGVEMPQGFDPPKIDASYENIIDRCAMAIDDIMGVHDVSRGQAPPNIESGLGISILTDNDNSPTARLIKETARCWSETARMCLQIYQTEVTEEREVVVQGDIGVERFKHKGSDLNSQFEVTVPTDAIVPRSRAAMVAIADKMWQQGLISEPAQYIEVAEMPGAETLISAIDPDTAKARRENFELVRGEIGDPKWHLIDNHDIHIREHERFMKTKRWEMLEDLVRTDFDNHIKMHKQYQGEARAAEVKMASLEAGAEAALAPQDPSMMMPPGAGPGGALPPGGAPPLEEMGADPADFLDYDELDVQDQLTGLMTMNDAGA